MSNQDSYTVMRMFVQLRYQIELAWRDRRDEDAIALSRIVGTLHVHVYGCGVSI